MLLSEPLEHLVLCSVINGLADFKSVKREELSRQGQFVYDGLKKLLKNKRPPFSKAIILSAAVDVAGGETETVRPFLTRVLDSRGDGSAEDILRAVHEKKTLLELVNMASLQMASGEFNSHAFVEKLQSAQQTGRRLVSVASAFQGATRHEMPEGIPLPDLPALYKATHGLFGVWALSGDSGVGKSTLTLQLALMAAKRRPVLFYDYENGQSVLHAHLDEVFGGNNRKIREATERLYFRDSVYSLDADLTELRTPCFIVVDSLQKIAVRGTDDKRAGLEKWIHRLEALKLLGHCILMVSEKNRSHYGRTGQAGYKESGDIEYTVDVGVELLADKDTNELIEVSINKNRNWPKKGYITTMTRSRSWMFVESKRRQDEEAR